LRAAKVAASPMVRAVGPTGPAGVQTQGRSGEGDCGRPTKVPAGTTPRWNAPGLCIANEPAAWVESTAHRRRLASVGGALRNCPTPRPLTIAGGTLNHCVSKLLP
jgi:hypothetical protein